MATDIDSLQIKIQGTAQGANKSINQLVKNLNTLQGALKNLDTSKLNQFANNSTKASNASKNLSSSFTTLNVKTKETSKSVGGLASAFGKFYASYFLVVRGVKSFAKSIKSTADYIESFNYYTVAFGKVASEWDEKWNKYGSENARNYSNAFVTSMNETLGKLSGISVNVDKDGKGLISSSNVKSLGINVKEVTQYASQLASVTNSLGQTGKTSLAISQSFTQLAGDISSLFNVDYSTVAKNLQSGLIGQSRALYKYGIDITNATLQTYAYKNGIDKAVSEMTQMEKQQLRVLAILDQARVSFGDLANTINSPGNQLRQLTNNLEQCGIVLGQLFMPMVEKVLPVINGLTIAIRQLMTDIAGFMGITIDFEKYGQGFNEIEDEAGGLTEELDKATESANSLKQAMRGFDKLNVVTIGGKKTESGNAGIDLTDKIVNSSSEYQKIWNEAYKNMENKAEEFAKNVSKYLEPIKKIIKDFAIGDYFQAGQDVSNLVVGINNFLSNAIENVDWDKVGEDFAEFLKGIEWTTVLSSFGELFWTAINSAIETYKSSFDAAPIETTIITAVGALTFTGLGKALIEAMIRSIKKSAKKMGETIVTTIFSPKSWGGFFKSDLGAFTMLASDFLSAVDMAITERADGTWVEGVLRVLGEALAGFSIGGIVGSFFGPAGTIAGAIFGAILGALNGIEIDGKSILSTIWGKLFNFDTAMYLFEEAERAFSTAFDGQRNDIMDIGGWILEGILDGFFGAMALIFEPFLDFFTWVWDELCNLFGIHSPAKEMEPIGENIFDGIIVGFENNFSTFTTSISKFWEEKVLPWFSKDKWSFSGVTQGLSSAWENGIAAVKEIWNKFANFLNSKLTWKIDPIVVFGKTLFEGTSINLGKIPTFATYETGGFPEDGFFFANHNELVGKFSNGQTAVANNEQIVKGIASGVRDANSEQNALLREQNSLLRQLLAKDNGITSKDVFDAVRTESTNYTRRTGQPAFI